MLYHNVMNNNITLLHLKEINQQHYFIKIIICSQLIFIIGLVAQNHL